MLKLIMGIQMAMGAQGLILPGPLNLANQEVMELDAAFEEVFQQLEAALVPSQSHFLFDAKTEGKVVRSKKFQHYYKGLSVVGSQAIHHTNDFGQTQVTKAVAAFDLDTNPSVSVEAAVSAAKGSAGDRVLKEEPSLQVFPSEDRTSAQLIYWVKLDRLGPGISQAEMDVLVDAHTGEVLAELPSLYTLGRAPVEPEEDEPELPEFPEFPNPEIGVPERVADVLIYDGTNMPEEALNENGAPTRILLSDYELVIKNDDFLGRPGLDAPDEAMLRAKSNADLTLAYYQSAFGRASFDDEGHPSRSAVHVGKNFANAFWHGDTKLMGYGDGGGAMKDLTLSQDVAGHEMTHGVVSETAKLVYLRQSGALNEAMADFFGEMIEAEENWIMGQNLFTDPELNKKGVRNLKNPHVHKALGKPYPKHMDEAFPTEGFCWRGNDNCWVHVNSTIMGHASYLIYQQIGREKTQELLYTTLTQYLTANSNF